MKVSSILFLPLAMLCLNPGWSSAGGQDTVATVGNSYAITFRDLVEYVHDRSYDRLYHSEPFGYAYKKALEDLVVDQLKRIDFFAQGLQHDSTLLQSNRRLINEELVIRYFEREYVRKYVNARAIREAYDQMQREVEYRILFVDTLALDPTKQRSSLYAAAKKLESERAQGARFDNLVSSCRRLLNAPDARSTTRTVTWKETLTGQADSIIFHLRPGDVRILMLPTGIAIVNPVKVNRRSIGSFESVQNEIYDALRQHYMYTCYDEFDRSKRALVSEQELRWNDRGLDKVLAWSNLPGFYGGAFEDTLSSEIADGRNVVLLHYRHRTVDLKEYLRLLNDVLILPARGQYKLADLKTYFLEALRTDLLIKKAKALGLERDVFHPNSRDPDLRNRIVALYNRREIDAKIPPLTEERARAFYAAHKDSLYYQLAKINIYAIISSDKRLIDSLWQIHLQGTPFEKLSHSWFVKAFIKDRDDDTIRSYLSLEKPFLGKAAFALDLNQVAGPVEYIDPEQGPRYAIIKCIEKRPEHQLTLDEARKTIGKDFREDEKKRIEAETVARLKARYPFSINEEVLMRDLAPQGGK
jgi:hypothetical protein